MPDDRCEVVLYTSDHDSSLAELSTSNDKKIVDLMFWRKKPASSAATTNKADTKTTLAGKNKPDAQKNNDMDDILDLTLPDD